MLTGQTRKSGMFPPTFRPAKQTVEQAKTTAAETRRKVLESMRTQGELDELVFRKTQEELALGWLEGPFLEQDLEDQVEDDRRLLDWGSESDRASVRETAATFLGYSSCYAGASFEQH